MEINDEQIIEAVEENTVRELSSMSLSPDVNELYLFYFPAT